MQRKLSFPGYVPPEHPPVMIKNDAQNDGPPGGLIGGASASPRCAGRRNERYYQCKPCESKCTDWVLKKKPVKISNSSHLKVCPQKCTPGCACIPNWHRKNQPGFWTGTCVRPTWCNPITQTKTVTKVVQPTKTVPGPPAPTTCAQVQCAAGSTCVIQGGKPVCQPGQTNPCATTVCTYGSTCVVEGGKAICKKVPICTSPKPCARQCKCKPGFARVNKVCETENLCHTNFRPKLTIKTKTVIKKLPPKTVPGPPGPPGDPCLSTTCEPGATCQTVDGKAVCTLPPSNPCAKVVCQRGKVCQVQGQQGICTLPPKDAPRGQPCLAKCSAGQRCELKFDDNSCYNPPCPGVPTCVPA
ncbi:EGF like subdomain protein [Ancylostoma ceylanicum]|uniref:EGF like subdomain protein n=1 Tax=Ancylostoma ceylanicum TaxID=53326 RepID=A0A0D6LQT1_9BILA|nr:EGF like subdomain protein [Ancylostoma ceylanicum]